MTPNKYQVLCMAPAKSQCHVHVHGLHCSENIGRQLYLCAEPKFDDPITTGRQPRAGFDPGSETVATVDDPGRGNVKTAAGNATTGGWEDKLLP